jgi:tRNA (adenine57-N1/adenine58-N1)-methyltransferase
MENAEITASLRAHDGDLVQLIGPRDKKFFVHLSTGKKLHTNYGFLNHDDLIEAPWGTQVFSHAGHRFLLLQPRMGDFLLKIRRNTQILYPKDIGFILLKMGVGPGDRVIEAGTGSGALTSALAHAVGPSGHIYSYEIRPELQTLATENLAMLGLTERVTFRCQDLAEGMADRDGDVMFLDLPRPEFYLPQVRQGLKNGGSLGCILPTTNQVSTLIKALEEADFDCIEVCELMIRYYKPVPARLRPKDRMVGHTGYLVFARKIIPLHPEPAA